MTIWEEIKYKLTNSASAVTQILWINILAFVLTCLIFLTFHLSGYSAEPILNYLNVPSDLGLMVMRPWTFLTYQFMHSLAPSHILFNMLMFYYMGNILQDFLGAQKIWYVYIGGGIGAAIMFVIIYNIIPIYSGQVGFLIGASGSVYAITVAAATLLPHYEIMFFGLFRIRLRWLALGLIVLNLAVIPVSNPGGGFAHLGGALFGWLYILFIKGDISNPFTRFFSNLNKIIPKTIKVDEKKIYREKVYSNTQNKKANTYRDKRNPKPNQDEIDAILDKISNSGYDSLTKEEREILFRASE